MDLRGIAILFIVLVIAAWSFGLGPEIKAFFAWLFTFNDIARYPTPGVLIEAVIKLAFILAVIALVVGAFKKKQ